jgi:enoyl-CoA hydratase/carnithine racemase
MGAVNRLYPTPDELKAGTLEFAHEVAETDPLALRQAKRAVNITMDMMGQHHVRQRFAELIDERPELSYRRDDD